MNIVKRVVIISLVLLVTVGGSIAGYIFMQPHEYSIATDPSVEVVEIERQSLLTTVNAVGKIEMEGQRSLTFRSMGIVDRVFVERGDMVKKGQILAQLDTSDLELALKKAELNYDEAKLKLEQSKEGPEATDILSAQAAVESARAKYADVLTGPSEEDVTIAARELREAEVSLKDAQEAYDQVAYRGDVGLMPQSTNLENATIAYEVAKAKYDQAVEGPTDAEIKAAESAVVEAESSLEKLLEGPDDKDIAIAQLAVQRAQMEVENAKLSLEHAVLYSPIDGIIVETDIKEGELATDTKVAITLADISEFHIDINVDELDIVLLEVGQPVEISLDALEDGEILYGHVHEIAMLANASQSGVVEYTVRIKLDTRSDKLRPGMSADATIEVGRLEDVLTVPNRFVQLDRTEGKAYVEKMDDEGNTTKRVEVQLGQRNDRLSHVLSGLEEGDKVVLRQVDRREQLRQAVGGG